MKLEWKKLHNTAVPMKLLYEAQEGAYYLVTDEQELNPY